MKIHPEKIHSFRDTILAHYKKHARTFAWRETNDPYEILVSEFMLQQTQTSRIAQRYPLFLRQFPTFESLASASRADVIAAWQGLGYNRRALSLKATAEAVVQEHGGVLPSDEKALRALPGIGAYTAAALRSFVFNEPSVMIETNIRAAHLHYFFQRRKSVAEAELHECVASTVDTRDPRHWYYALMDYGVYVKALCPSINQRCASYKKQSPFKGSNRQVRGAIIRVLAGRPGLSAVGLRKEIAADDDVIARNLSALADEGFLRKRAGRWYLAR